MWHARAYGCKFTKNGPDNIVSGPFYFEWNRVFRSVYFFTTLMVLPLMRTMLMPFCMLFTFAPLIV